jgi:AbrB family looped-hinge helix DNA binding protein
MNQTIVADGRGRLLLPKELREQLNLKPGGAVTADLDASGAVVLRDARAALDAQFDRALGVAEDAPGSVEQLIADRRAEAARDHD